MTDTNKKDYKLFYSIGEVSEMLDISISKLRFWESKIPQISPHKGSRGIRSYTKEDIATIRRVQELVDKRGLKIAAVSDILRQNKEGTAKPLEAIMHLRQIREELVAMKAALESM